jgi:hypothetical protein
MGRKRTPDWNRTQLTDREINVLIRYLDPNPESGKDWTKTENVKEQDHDTAFVICVSLLILVLGFLGFLWLYYR